MARVSSILDEFGRPIVVRGKRPKLREMAARGRGRRGDALDARYDAAGDGSEIRNHYASADNLDADSANSRAVRQKLVSRARYEADNNGYMAGMLDSYADFLIGRGPALRMQTGNTEFNQVVEKLFGIWAKQVKLRRKLWCMAHAKVQDGEAIGLLGVNHRIPTAMQLDLKLIETEQCQSPYLTYMQADHIDGIRLYESGDPEWYEILKYHPGNNQVPFNRLESSLVPAEEVLHWFRLKRPGQHRATPEFSSTLNTGAASRRFREATVGAAESAAEFNIMLETQAQANSGVDPDPVEAFSELPFTKRMLSAIPMGWRASHFKSEHPNSTFEMFCRQQLMETARPKCIPYNVAAGDSSGYNFASGKLDHQTFFTALDNERLDCEDLCLDKLFLRWWLNALDVFGWGGSPYRVPDHVWVWPKYPVADVVSAAKAADINLRNGTLTLTRHYAELGHDFEDELAVMARDYGVSVKKMREILLRTLLAGSAAGGQPPKQPPAGAAPADGEDKPDPDADQQNEEANDEQQ